MKYTKLTSYFLLLALASSCGKAPDSPSSGAVGSGPGQIVQPEQPEPPVNPVLADFHRATLWSRPVSSSLSWTKVVLDVIQRRLADFEQARDVEAFCPGYGKASLGQRQVCWLRLVGGVVEFESSFRPSEPPFQEANGGYSVGLMALSQGECPNAPTNKDLLNPIQNLICGVNKMAVLIARYKAIDSPDFKGACAYWSTLRPPYKKWDPKRNRWLLLGKKEKIIERTRKFRDFL